MKTLPHRGSLVAGCLLVVIFVTLAYVIDSFQKLRLGQWEVEFVPFLIIAVVLCAIAILFPEVTIAIFE